MSKTKNIYGVADPSIRKNRNRHKHRNNSSLKWWLGSPLMNFLAGKSKLAFVTQIFLCLSMLMVTANAWAVPTISLSVGDTVEGDEFFNGKEGGQQLRITFSVSDDAAGGPYAYTITAVGQRQITSGSVNVDETEIYIWDGGSLPDGTYTIRVELTDEDPVVSAEASATLDKTAPEISIGVDATEFSPNRDRVLDTVEVFYSIDEDVKESALKFYRGTGPNTPFGQPVSLRTSRGNYDYDWDGGGRGRNVFPDGQYVLQLSVVDKAGNAAEVQTTPITIDTVAPIISSVVANDDLRLINGSFVNVPIQLIEVTADAAGGTALDLASDQNEITLKNQRNVTIDAEISYDAPTSTLALGNSLDTASENGRYTLSIAVADKAGNAAEKTVNFTFDNVAPNLTEVATSNGEFTPGGGVSTWTNFVEATLNDNLQNGLNLADSTIRLTGPDGAVLGRQTQPTADKIRWNFLSPLLARDGIMDGVYTIEINAVDKAGNQTGALQIPFIFDNLPPVVTLGSAEESPFTLNQDTIYHAQPLLQVVATFDDAGVGVDLDEDIRVTFGTTRADGQINTLPGRTIRIKERNQLVYLLETPLVNRDGSQDGRYALNVQATDTLGNTETYEYQFVYDTQLPTLVSTLPAANASVSELSEVRVVLDEATSGIDFIQSTFQLTREVNGEAVPVPVNLTSNGTDAATLTLAKPIALDGSDDGTYTIEISPTDLAGNVGVTVQREFYLVSQSRPEIRLTMPETTTVNNLTTVTAELSDYIGAGIDFDASVVAVRNPQGRLIRQTELEHDAVNNLLIWNIDEALPRDGSADGEYSITAIFVDFTGRRFAQQFPLLLDTQIPGINSVQIATESQLELSTDRATTVAENFSQIVVTFEDTSAGTVSAIDFANTGVTLTNPAGENIAINTFDDGENVLTLSFQALTQRGEYVLTITPQDLAGNQRTAPLVYRLRVGVPLPTVTSVLVGGKLGVIVYVNGDASDIVATFADLSGAGIDLDDGGSTIAVTSEAGLPIPGITTSNGTDQLTWTPIVLPANGSADGSYTVVVTPKDKAGRQGDVTYRQFVYDTQEPRITAATPVSLTQPVTYINGSLTQFQFTVEDVGPAGLELSEQTAELLDPQGAAVSATLTFDEISDETSGEMGGQLYLTLDSPLARDGSADGEYTLILPLVDRSGNVLNAQHVFVYDSRVPNISSVSVNTETSLELLPQEIAEVSESISSITLQFEDAAGIDFTNTQITLTGPDEASIPITLSDDGVSELIVSFQNLHEVGAYTLAVTAQDIAGNVAPGAINYRFVLDLPLPSVSSVMIGEQSGSVAYVNASNVGVNVTFLEPAGVNLSVSEGSSIVVMDPSGAVVPGQTRASGTNQLVWQPISLPADGSADGRYTVAITPVDKAGREGDVVYRQFIYDTQEPRITDSTPVSLSQPITYISGALTQFQFTIEDVGPAGLVLEDQRAILLNSRRAVIRTTLTFDEISSQLYLTLGSPFAQDGSADGEYTLRLPFVDRAGNVLNLEHVFVYDSQVPRVSSVLVNTESPMALVRQQIAEITESISSVTLQFEETTRVDFANTVVSLVGPDGQPVPMNISADGLTQLTARFVALTQAGLYTLSITPQDIAGNAAQGAVQYTFRLDFVLPSVSAVELGGQVGDVVFLNGRNTTIVATLVDGGGSGLALGDGGSSIVVTGPSGEVVPGQTRAGESDELIWDPISLPADGSADGRYTVAITPIDQAGREGDVVYRQFIYDTQEPRITDSTPVSLIQPITYIGGALTQFQFTVEDVGPADLVLADQKIELLDAQGAAIPAIFTSDEINNQLYLTLDAPFAQDGSADGEYVVKVSLVDKSGNMFESAQRFVYDSQVPRVSSVLVNTESPMALVPQQIAEITESISSITLQFEEATRVDFANTVVSLMGPDGQSVPISLSADGLTQLTVHFIALIEAGLYTLYVTPQDMAGNAAQSAVRYAFQLDFTLPSVSAVELDGQMSDIGFLNGRNTTIVATLVGGTGAGLALGDGGSSIVVMDPSGVVVPGQTRAIGTNQLVWQPISLPTDGSADGRYTVAITPIDQAGREGDVVYRQFIYDTQEPRITASTPVSLSQPISYIGGSLTQFQFTVEDVGPAGLALDAQMAELLDAEGASVSATLTYDEINSQLYFTLDVPLVQDGSADGEYTLRLPLVDRSGNTLDLAHVFVYDSQVPRVASVLVNTESPMALVRQQIAEITESISSITLQFEEATRVDFANTVVSLMGPDGQSIPTNISSDGLTQLTARFVALTQAGLYTLSITPQDIAGNAAQGAVQYTFRLDFVLPSVSAVELGGQVGDVVFLNGRNTTIVATLVDGSGSGLALGDGGSSIIVMDPSGAVVPGQTRASGTNQLVWQPISLPTDGSADGRYTVAITPIDQAGREGDVVYRQFIYDTQEPRITDSMPVSLIQPANYIGGSLTQFQFTVEDVGPADLVLADQKIELLDAQGAAIPAIFTSDEINNQLYLTLDAPFAQDGSADGEYVVKVSLVDKSGNMFESAQRFVYDSQVPRVSSVLVNTESPMALVPQQIAEITESISSVTLHFEETTRVDFANTVVSLMGPDGQPVPMNISADGFTQLTARFVALTQVGLYTLSVTPQDIAGNAAQGAVQYAFRLNFVLPTVSVVELGGQIGDVVFLNGRNTTIVATLVDGSGSGLALGDGGSSIVVMDPSGVVVPGQTRASGTNQLVWQPISLPADGSADGRYTVAITPVDQAGREGDVVYRQFIYDTQEPRITDSTPVSLIQPANYIGGSLTQFQFTVEDVGPAGLVLADQKIELLDAQGAAIPAIFTSDEINNQLYLTLDAPFAQDGSVDGEYVVKVSLVDKSGNMFESAQRFVYDSQVPRVSSALVNTESPMALVPQQIAEITESISSVTLHFEETTRVDFESTIVSLMGPDGQPVPMNISADGFTQLTARFVALTQVGLYTLSVTPQDIAGNAAQGAVQYAFRLNFVLPTVSVVELGGQIGDVVFLNGTNTTMVATLVDGSGSGLALGDGGSSIVVTGPSGAVVPGQTRAIGTNQLVWQPISLPTDGSADGRYTVTITPIDKAGRQGDVVHREFIYDTEVPRITASAPLTLSQPVSYISGGLDQFSFTVEDVGPADLLLESQTIALIDSADGVVPATLTFDELTNQLYLTLSIPFARDGSVDGAYTMLLSLVDRAGNALNVEHALIYDSQAPQLALVIADTETPVELIPQGTAEISEPVSSITLHFDEATRVDFANTVITLVSSGVSATTGDTEVVDIPLTLQDNGTSQMTVSFVELDQLDTYLLSVTPQDIAGNAASAPTNYTFILDIPLPVVSSVIIGDIETAAGGDVIYINASNAIIGAVLEDPTETGLDFGSDGSDITVADTANTIVPGTTGSNGVNLLIWEPITLTTDGTTDGRYSVYVTPVDKAGREGNTIYREFIYDTQEPEILVADPIDLSQPVSYISETLTQFQFTIVDVGPADLVLADQNVSLRDASGNLVPARLTNDTANQVFLTLDQPLPRDGSMDGEYTVVIEFSDRSGNALNIEHALVYDTQSPTVVSTIPADRALLAEDITQIQVTLNDEGGSGIDWSMTTITLENPSGQQIVGELINNGTTTLTLSTNQLVEDGRYIVRVQAIDRAGNGGVTSLERSFVLSRRLPVITSTEPVTAPADEAFTNEEIEQIVVNLETDDANHLSTLRLLNRANQVVAGQQERLSGRLIYNLVRPLATDGSEDGVYTIEFTPISASGRSGEVQRLTFTYDTQSPEIENDDAVQFVVAASAGNNSLTEIRVTPTDDTSGIDWENLDDAWITFQQLSPNRAKVSGRVSEDGQSTLIFRLTTPLADNGSADGEYQITVNPIDRAGNDDEPYKRIFVYDTSPPMIDVSTLLINEVPLLVDLDAENYPSAVSTTSGVVIQASIFDTGLGVNLTQSHITVRGPDGSEVAGNTQQNGVDTIVFKSGGLTLQGPYQVTVTSVGNDSERLGFAPVDSITTQFLYETDEPTAAVTSDGGETELTDEPILFEGTASDPEGTQRIGEGEITVPPSGVWLVEIVGIGPDDQPIDPVPAVDDSGAQEEPWSRWSIDFLPSRSGEYELDVRVTDNAGNYAVYDIGTYTMSVSLTFRGSTYGWPNPLRLSNPDVAFFSFDVNVPLGETVDLTLSIYDWSGDMVYEKEHTNVVSGQRNDQLVKWNLENQAGTPVARGLYIFRLEAVNAAGNSANVVGKVLVVD